MGPYAYPITVNRRRQRINYTESVLVEKDDLTLGDLAFVGDDTFLAEESSGIGYLITVHRNRLETAEERDKRVTREEAYMVEYNKRQEERCTTKKK